MFENLSIFNADSLEGFIITNSLVGLGLIIAIYAFMSPVLKELLIKRKNELKELIEERGKLYKKMDKNKEDTLLTTNYKNTQKQIKKLSRIPLHLESGYQIPTVLFTYSIFISIFKIIITPTNTENFLKIINLLGNLAFTLFVSGIIVFIFFFLNLLYEIKEYTSNEFQKIIEKEEKKEDKIEKYLKEVNKT